MYNQIVKLQEEMLKIKDKIIIDLQDNLANYESEIRRLRLDNINIQFKYDIALNMMSNQCGRYFIDTLENDNMVEEAKNFVFNKELEVFQYEGV
jgi:hypothetical protein